MYIHRSDARVNLLTCHGTLIQSMLHVPALYPGLPMFFNVSRKFSCETLKNMGRPGYEATLYMYMYVVEHMDVNKKWLSASCFTYCGLTACIAT